MNHIESTITTPEYIDFTNEKIYTSTPHIIINNKIMNKNQQNTDKILKLIDKFDTEDLSELNNILKDHMTKRIMDKSLEYSERAEKLQSISEKIKGE